MEHGINDWILLIYIISSLGANLYLLAKIRAHESRLMFYSHVLKDHKDVLEDQAKNLVKTHTLITNMSKSLLKLLTKSNDDKFGTDPKSDQRPESGNTESSDKVSESGPISPDASEEGRN